MSPLETQVLSKSLCTGCGTCSSICPNKAISMTLGINDVYTPRIDRDKCNNCGLCLRCCPGPIVDYHALEASNLSLKNKSRYVGNYIKGYISYAADNALRHTCSSGGLVTSILTFCLENRLIDGVLVTGMDPWVPWQPRPFIARTVDQVVDSAGSKYCPVPANMALKEIMSTEGRYAIVGLPCHIYAARKALQYNKQLKKRILYMFGLFCASGRSFKGLLTLLGQIKIKEDDICKLAYRGNGWPGDLTINTKKGSIKIPLEEYYPIMCLHNPFRCSLCPDKSSELADISFGDMWLPEERENIGSGKSVCITRSINGHALFEAAVNAKIISATSISENDLIRAIQPENKKKVIRSRINLCQMMGKSTPTITGELDRSSFFDYCQSIKYYWVQYFCQNNRFLSLYLRSRSKYRQLKSYDKLI